MAKRSKFGGLMGLTVGDIGEFELIARVRERVGAGRDGVLGIGDDGAVIATPTDRSARLVVTTDTMVEGRHFRRDFTSFRDLGNKLMSVNLSDLAAMGAHPAAATVTLQIPGTLLVTEVEEFYRGLLDAAGELQIIGGDTVQSDVLAVGLTAFGWAARPILRSSAAVGDDLWVSGPIGGGGLGLAICRGDVDPATLPDQGSAALRRYRTPVAQTALGLALVGIASAAIDVSDGLLQDLGHVARLSGVDLVVELESVPLVEGCEAVLAAVTAGDDYELAFTASPASRSVVEQLAGVRRIGRAIQPEREHGQLWIDREGIRQSAADLLAGLPQGYQHFQVR